MITYEDFRKVDIRVGRIQSEVLTLGVIDKTRKNNWFLIQPDREVELGTRVE